VLSFFDISFVDNLTLSSQLPRFIKDFLSYTGVIENSSLMPQEYREEV